MKKAKITYWAALLAAIIIAVALEMLNIADGLVEQQAMVEIYAQYASIMITLVLIYLALKLIGKNPVIRILMLIIPMTANTIMYHVFSLTPSFGYLAIMCLLAYAFVYPANTNKEELTTDEDKTDIE